MQLALSNRRLGYFTKNGKQYQVIGQVFRQNREMPVNLNSFYVRSASGHVACAAFRVPPSARKSRCRCIRREDIVKPPRRIVACATVLVSDRQKECKQCFHSATVATTKQTTLTDLSRCAGAIEA